RPRLENPKRRGRDQRVTGAGAAYSGQLVNVIGVPNGRNSFTVEPDFHAGLTCMSWKLFWASGLLGPNDASGVPGKSMMAIVDPELRLDVGMRCRRRPRRERSLVRRLETILRGRTSEVGELARLSGWHYRGSDAVEPGCVLAEDQPALLGAQGLGCFFEFAD